MLVKVDSVTSLKIEIWKQQYGRVRTRDDIHILMDLNFVNIGAF